jgi:acetolactate synthase-1/2/3 large subunit
MEMSNPVPSKSKTKTEPELLTGSEILVQALLDEGVDTVFGYPGGTVIGLYDTLFRNPKLRHILVRHEQGATHAADGYARATGKPGVVLVTSGPGATNTVTGIANAYMDSIPIVVITGQVVSTMIGNDAFQEADIIGITRPITKHSYLVKKAEHLSAVVQEAFHLATTGRPGPVLIDLPKDIQATKAPYVRKEGVSIRGYNPTYEGHTQQIAKAAKLIMEAKRPLIYAGGGVILADGSGDLRTLALQGQIPVTTTLLGLGAFPEDHPLSLGMLGMHGTWAANMAITECDVVLAVGARFDDRVTGRLDAFSKDSKKIHIDIDPSCIAKNVAVDVPIVGHIKNVLPTLVSMVKKTDTAAWLERIEGWKKEHPLKYTAKPDRIMPQAVIETIAELTRHEAIVVTDVGQNQMWAAQFYKFKNPRSFLSSGGLGTMGFGLPAAIGAAFGRPDATVVCFTGDGGFQMNIQELATAVKNRLPIKIAILNNGYLGMVRQWQELFFGGRYSHTFIQEGNPDFVRLAEAYGAVGLRVVKPEDVAPAVRKALEVKDLPVVIDFIVDPEEKVMPMVPAGAPITNMME